MMRGKSVYKPPLPLTIHKLNHLVIDDRRIEIHKRVGRRRRSRVMLSYHPDGILFVDAPRQTTDRALRIIIFRNEPWLRKEIQKYKNGDLVVYPTKYESGRVLYVLGSPATLRVHSQDQTTVNYHDSSVVVGAPEDAPIRPIVHDWYRELANTVFYATVRRICTSTNLLEQLPTWKHRFMTSKWGSCSSSGTMHLNTHLVKVPQQSIDMVVLHELCHFKELNHGPKFYELMNHHMPDWKKHDATLTRYQQLLHEQVA